MFSGAPRDPLLRTVSSPRLILSTTRNTPCPGAGLFKDGGRRVWLAHAIEVPISRAGLVALSGLTERGHWSSGSINACPDVTWSELLFTLRLRRSATATAQSGGGLGTMGMNRHDLYFRLSVIWLTVLVSGLRLHAVQVTVEPLVKTTWR